ncbi:MAG: nucleotidyltransferase family protein [Elainellaceae cyanobacterium]
MSQPQLDLPMDDIRSFCQKWQITELALFGSVLREDFRSDSDVDMLVRFVPRAPWTLLDLVNMENELADLIGRDVDLVEKRAIEKSDNWVRRSEILSTAQTIYSQTYEPA